MGNKVDIVHGRVVSADKAEAYVAQHPELLFYTETSGRANTRDVRMDREPMVGCLHHMHGMCAHSQDRVRGDRAVRAGGAGGGRARHGQGGATPAGPDQSASGILLALRIPVLQHLKTPLRKSRPTRLLSLALSIPSASSL